MPAAWSPTYAITSRVAQALMTIEAAKTAIGALRLAPATEAAIRHSARVRSTHYSTRIEGNRLTLEQAADVIAGTPMGETVRERDVREVQYYWDALDHVEALAARHAPVTESLVQKLHAIVERGARAKPTPYRTAQNVIRDAATGQIIYMPPEAHDVPTLMQELVLWATQATRDHLPSPIMAGLLHYQFVTIHPYYDGNGRTARLLSTFILHRDGYGLNGFFSLEEHHAKNLQAYYTALVTHPHHNYYEGRATTDLTGWIEYFVTLTARVFDDVRTETLRLAAAPAEPEVAPPVMTDRRARIILALFATQSEITTNDVANALGVSPRQARNYIAEWVSDGWLTATSPARKNRAYRLV